MKQLKLAMIAAFSLLVLLPIVTFCWEPDIVSEIDNRMLAKNPFSPEVRAEGKDLTADIESYISDRIGFRDQMILGYTLLNDRLFGKMVHPIYSYGKDGNVFASLWTPPDVEFEWAFATKVKQIQTYCEERSVPFLLAVEPSKSTVLTEYLPAGFRYDNTWWDILLTALDGEGVRYINNTSLLQRLAAEGISVFNQKYDAGHWNDIGAFYGVNAILSDLQSDFPRIHVNTWEELEVSEQLATSLPASKFPIHEFVPKISIPMDVESLSDSYSTEIEIDPSYCAFGYYTNPDRLEQGSPKALVFQGSYMNEYGTKYFMNALGTYIYVHNYENIINFDYYFNIFQPECVVLEVTEYALNRNYFNFDNMTVMQLNPPLSSVQAEIEEDRTLLPESLTVEQGRTLTTLTWTGGDGDEEFVWVLLGGEFDMHPTDSGWTLTVETSVWTRYHSSLTIAAKAGSTLRKYK